MHAFTNLQHVSHLCESRQQTPVYVLAKLPGAMLLLFVSFLFPQTLQIQTKCLSPEV